MCCIYLYMNLPYMFVDGLLAQWVVVVRRYACSSQLRIMQPQAGVFVYVRIYLLALYIAYYIIYTGSMCVTYNQHIYTQIHTHIYFRRKIIKRSRFNFIALLSFLDLLLCGPLYRACTRVDVMACLAAAAFAGFFMYYCKMAEKLPRCAATTTAAALMFQGYMKSVASYLCYIYIIYIQYTHMPICTYILKTFPFRIYIYLYYTIDHRQIYLQQCQLIITPHHFVFFFYNFCKEIG